MGLNAMQIYPSPNYWAPAKVEGTDFTASIFLQESFL